jgi:hypothetical protein
VPTFVPVPAAAMPSARFRAEAATLNGTTYVGGGSTALGPAVCTATNRGNVAGTTTFMAVPDDLSAGWTALPAIPNPRVEHAMVVVPDALGTTGKVYVFYGQNAGTSVPTISEYTP